MASRIAAGAGNRDRVYLAIKARAIACEFSPGEPIRLSPLAAQLGVSATPIRAALSRLVAEGLVTREPQKGFAAMRMSERRFAGLYRLNRLLLDSALTMHSPGAEVRAATTATIARIGSELDGGGRFTPDAIAGYTGALFSCIAQLSTNAHIVESVNRINNRLHFVRVLEHEQLDDVPGELASLCEFFLAEQFDAAVNAIADYHASRLALLPQLLDIFRH